MTWISAIANLIRAFSFLVFYSFFSHFLARVFVLLDFELNVCTILFSSSRSPLLLADALCVVFSFRDPGGRRGDFARGDADARNRRGWIRGGIRDRAGRFRGDVFVFGCARVLYQKLGENSRLDVPRIDRSLRVLH